MKLYEVTVEYVIYVLAETEDDAEETAVEKCENEKPEFVHSNEIDKKERITHEWRDSIPYGEAQNDETCNQAFDRLSPAPSTDGTGGTKCQHVGAPFRGECPTCDRELP